MHTRLQMIEGVYNINPKTIMAQVAIEAADCGDLEYMPNAKN